MDALENSFRTLRISGSVLLREQYESPWAIVVPEAQTLADLLKINKQVVVVAFHLVEFGQCDIKLGNDETYSLKAGEMAICFGGNAHELYQGTSAKPQKIESLLAGEPNEHHKIPESHSNKTSLLCGAFLLSHTNFNPLFTALPRVMHTHFSQPGKLNNLSSIAKLMANEIDRQAPGSNYVVERLLEILCAEAIRSYLESCAPNMANWFSGLKDPVIARAISAIHENPGWNWSVKRLADGVAMSPSRFATRFSDSVGDSPMSYVSKWRMSLACQALTESNQTIEQITEKVGYESSAAFSRAFKKYLGISPAAWRSQAQA